MYSQTPKVLHNILGKPIVLFVVELAEKIASDEIIIVVGKNCKGIENIVGDKVRYAIQETPLGSGDAAKKGIKIARQKNILILSGDVPLLTPTTIRAMFDYHKKQKAKLTIVTCELEKPFGYGRIIRNKERNIIDIIEQSDATLKEQRIKEINAGVYYGERDLILSALGRVTTQNQQGEFYLTDIIKECVKKREKVAGFKISNEQEILGINNKVDLTRVREIVKAQWFNELMKKGVYIEDSMNTNIDLTVKIGKFVHIRPFTIIEGNTKIKDNMTIGPFMWIKDGKKKRFQ